MTMMKKRKRGILKYIERKSDECWMLSKRERGVCLKLVQCNLKRPNWKSSHAPRSLICGNKMNRNEFVIDMYRLNKFINCKERTKSERMRERQRGSDDGRKNSARERHIGFNETNFVYIIWYFCCCCRKT